MPTPYPIVESKPLPPVGRSGWFGLGERRRDWADLPAPKADHAYVYLVDGRHVVDHGRLGPGDDIVVRATHVSVVDLTVNRGVSVELAIPSADAKQFTVRAHFQCTVLEPDKVVKCGQGDATTVLLDYLRGYQKLFQLGLPYKISDVDKVSLIVQTQVESYNKHVPPEVPGMRVVYVSTQVLTPGELVDYYDSRFRNEQQFLTDVARTRQQMQLEQLEAARVREQELQAKSHELRLAEQQHSIDMTRQRSRHRLAEEDNRFAAGQARMLTEAIGRDPQTAAYYALQKGEGSAEQITAALQQGQADAEARRRELEDREFALRKADRERAWAVEDRDVAWQREQQERALREPFSLVKELAKRGHLDEVGYDEVCRLMVQLITTYRGELDTAAGPRPGLDAAAEPRPELDAAAEPGSELPEADDFFSEDED
ncbi:hypothetical protein Acsp04_28280 [Actinomadura sp. NBRC 104425]|uniref:hypothetical protein n=1 Tax=Actinomadura sp. NBRC 104425 TaxID=3032204 RepID=UPI0024A3C3BA|nr:hypothetical protein [Actinomadura sp. NBRC 104425]GLZ12593.1 hypothetical protein Acsp04_28280 [Actinomadura sp. NBRC 104425]